MSQRLMNSWSSQAGQPSEPSGTPLSQVPMAKHFHKAPREGHAGGVGRWALHLPRKLCALGSQQWCVHQCAHQYSTSHM